jgi:thiol:disulfide interchange protein DsbC
MNKKLGVCLLMVSGLVYAHQLNAETTGSNKASELTAEVKDLMRSVDEVKRLPVSGLSLIKAGEHRFLISDNGHFVVAGQFKLVDLWQGKLIESIADTQGIEKVNLRKIGLNPDELTRFSIGSGNKEVVIFIDPQCRYCHELITQLEPLGKDYVFKLVLIPVLGKESAQIAKQLLCNKDPAQSLKALLSQDFSILPALVREEGACDLKPLQKAVVATKLLDIQGVPYLFLPSQNTFRGGVKSLATLLEKDSEDALNGR